MKLPDAIKCGAFVYRVRHKKRLCSSDHDRLKGQARHNDLEIRLDKGMRFPHQRETLLHEVLHAVDVDRGLELSEDAVHQLSVGLAAVLLDNPDLTRLFLVENGGDR